MWLISSLLMMVSLVSLYLWRMTERAAQRRAWLDRMQGARNGTLGVGISALVSSGVTAERCARLLGIEYAMFEVVVVVNGLRDVVVVEQLCTRYHLIRVEYHPSGELPVRGVVGLYRSRMRRFRRLVVVDCRMPGLAASLDAAADVASYDYLLPLRSEEYPLVGAVERLAMEVALHPLDRVDQICYLPALHVVLWRRVALVRIGGFARLSMFPMMRTRCLMAWIGPTRRMQRRRWRSLAVYGVLWALAALAIGLVGVSWLRSAWWLMMLVWVLLCWLRVRQIADEGAVV